MHFTEYDTRLAAYAVIVQDGQMLLTWFNGGPFADPCWSLPGGGVEFDEGIAEAIVREVYEETGFHVQVDGFLLANHFVRHGQGARPYKSQRFLFAATIIGGTLGTVEVEGTTDFARWMPVSEIATLAPRADLVTMAHAAITTSPASA